MDGAPTGSAFGLYFSPISFRLQHSSRICLTVREHLHLSQSGWLSPESRYLWVTRVWRMRSHLTVLTDYIHSTLDSSDLLISITMMKYESGSEITQVAWTLSFMLQHSSLLHTRRLLQLQQQWVNECIPKDWYMASQLRCLWWLRFFLVFFFFYFIGLSCFFRTWSCLSQIRVVIWTRRSNLGTGVLIWTTSAQNKEAHKINKL